MTTRVCFVGMGEVGHFMRLRPLIGGFVSRGAEVHVLTDSRFREEVASAGATFVDLFDRYPLAEADDESIPIPCRFVTYAGRFGDEVVKALGDLAPDLILYDTFAVVGHLAGRALGVPYVNVCAGHDRVPARFMAESASDPPPAISSACERAVDVLRDRYGIEDASPFSYVAGISPHLNVYCEPPEFLPAADRATFEPLEFFGSLQLDGPRDERKGEPPSPWPAPGGRGTRVYASFGTVVWRYWPERAVATLAAIAEAIAADPSAQGVISLGGAELSAANRKALERDNVRVCAYVDQWALLEQADAFVTHSGLNSTHEAIYHRVPMITYPFFTDQPALAERCQSFDLAVPLGGDPRSEITAGSARAALAVLERDRPRLESGLELAREAELRTVAGRDQVLDRLLALPAEVTRAA